MEFSKFNYKSIDEFSADITRKCVPLKLSNDLSVFSKKVMIGDVECANSLAVHPMEGCDALLDGSPGELTFRRYERFGAGGAGLIWFEAIAVVHEGKNFPNQLYINKDNIDTYKSLVKRTIDAQRAAHSSVPICIAQLTHSGRFSKPFGKPQPQFPYSNPHLDLKPVDCTGFVPVSDEYLAHLEDEFVAAAVLSKEAGFQGVDVKACHKYLNSELLAAYTRDGVYGGDFEGRTRFTINVIDKIKKVVGDDFIIASRVNVYDGMPYPYGWGVDKNDFKKPDFREPIKLIKLMADHGVSLVNCTMGTPYYNPHVNRPYDAGGYIPVEHPLEGVSRLVNGIGEIARECPKVKIVGTGYSWPRHFAPHVAAAALADGKADLIGFGRQAFAYPDFARDLLQSGSFVQKKCCVSCSKCAQLLRGGKFAGCVVRDSEIYAKLYVQMLDEAKA